MKSTAIGSLNDSDEENYSYSKSGTVRGDLEGAISKLSELIERDLDLSISMSDHDIYESCMKDKELIKDKNGNERVPLGEKTQNSLNNQGEVELSSSYQKSLQNLGNTKQYTDSPDKENSGKYITPQI